MTLTRKKDRVTIGEEHMKKIKSISWFEPSLPILKEESTESIEDMKGTKIYTGDIVAVRKEFDRFTSLGTYGVVMRRRHRKVLGIYFLTSLPGTYLNDGIDNYYNIESNCLEVVGNISNTKYNEKIIPPVKFKDNMSVDRYIKLLIKEGKDKDRVKWLKTYQNCILPDDVKKEVEGAIITVLKRDKFDEWGVNEHFEKGITNAILLYGPPGTGKTMISESIAAVLGMNLIRVGNNDIQSSLPGATEKNMTKIFAQATSNNAAILFDECDSFLYNRNDVGAISAGHINHLLGEIERFKGVIILTTNRLRKLDPALQRRIISKVQLPTPSMKARKKIWKKLFPPKTPLNKDINFNSISKFELTGGDIKNTILLSIRESIKLRKQDVDSYMVNDSIKKVLKAKREFEGGIDIGNMEDLINDNQLVAYDHNAVQVDKALGIDGKEMFERAKTILESISSKNSKKSEAIQLISSLKGKNLAIIIYSLLFTGLKYKHEESNNNKLSPDKNGPKKLGYIG